MRSFHAFSWKLVYPAGLDSHASPCRIKLQEGAGEVEGCRVCVWENVYWFLFSYKGAQSIEEQLLVFAAFHTPHKGPAPTAPRSRQEICPGQHHSPILTPPSQPCSSHFPLWLVFLICSGEEKAFSLIYLLSRSAQRVNELMFIKCTVSQREPWIEYKVWLLLQGLISGV